jgi:hypothetical protein
VGNSEEHDRQKQPPYLDPALVIDTRLSEIERQQAEEKKQQQGYNRKQLRFNGLLVLFTGLLFVTSIVSDLLMFRYVDLTKQSAKAAKIAAYSACVSAQVARTALIEVQRSGDDAHESARAASAQAVAALRAEAAVMTTAFSEQPLMDGSNDEAIRVIMNVTNTGKTDARKFVVNAASVFIPANEDPEFVYRPHHFSANGRVLAPGNDLTGGMGITADRTRGASVSVRNDDGSDYKAKPWDVSDYQKGEKDVVIYGSITYGDIFGIQHWSHFCRSYQRFPGRGGKLINSRHSKCANYNDDDENSVILRKEAPRQKDLVPAITCIAPGPIK